MKKTIGCKHKMPGSFYIYELIGLDLMLCLRCARKLKKGVFVQDKLEMDLKPRKKE